MNHTHLIGKMDENSNRKANISEKEEIAYCFIDSDDLNPNKSHD